jgi:hypothetical protein
LRNTYRLLKLLDLNQHDQERSYHNDDLLHMVFWQEYLHHWPQDERHLRVMAAWGEAPASDLTEAEHQRIDSALTRLLSSERFMTLADLISGHFMAAQKDDPDPRWSSERARYDSVAGFVERLILPFGEAAAESSRPASQADDPDQPAEESAPTE